MNEQLQYNSCPTDEIAAYIDGELSLEHESEMDIHLAGCPICSHQLTQQKQFLCGLNSSLKNECEIELPANFTKLIVAGAESTVSGLRKPRERFNAIFICAGLSLFVLFAMGAEAGKVFASVAVIIEQISAVGSFFGHLAYSVFVGVVMVLRSLAGQFRLDAVMVALVVGFLAVTVMFFSRKLLRMRRV